MAAKSPRTEEQDMAAMDLKRYIRDIPDCPTKGILFRDITPLLRHGPAFRAAIRALAARHHGRRPDAVVAIESRGLIVGSALAVELGVGIVPVRKKGKLPHDTYQASYTLEYGQDTLEIHQDALHKGARVVLADEANPQRVQEIQKMSNELGLTYWELAAAQGLAQGETKGIRETVLLQGRKRFGEPDEATQQALQAITDLERLRQLSERLLDVSSWQELLQGN